MASFASALTSLDMHAISYVASFLTGADLMKLFRAGSKDLNRKLASGVRDIDLELISPTYICFSRILAIFAEFRHLTSFHVTTREPYIVETLEEAIPWSLLPPTIESLQLPFRSGSTAYSTLKLVEYFPYLQTLTIPVIPSPIDSGMAIFPPGLTSLEFTNNIGGSDASQLFLLLPDTLTTLICIGKIRWTSTEAPNLHRLSSLKTIRLELQDTCATGHLVDWRFLPPSVTDLQVLMEFSTAPQCCTPYSTGDTWASLFPSLTHLNARDDAIVPLLAMDSPIFPLSLTHMTVSGADRSKDNFLSSLAPLLGSQITSLRWPPMDYIPYHALPNWSRLETMDLDRKSFWKFDFSDILRHVRTLSLGSIDFDSFKKLPCTLTDLRFTIDRRSEEDNFTHFNGLPNLTSLTLNLIHYVAGSTFNLDLLPTTLRHLRLRVGVGSNVMCSGGISHLNRLKLLESNSGTLKPIWTFADVYKIPKSVELLLVHQMFPSEMPFLAQDLKTHFTNLTTLNVTARGSVTEGHPLGVFHLLPPTVTTFTGRAARGEIWTEAIVKAIPRAMERLTCTGAKGWEANTAIALKFLPKGLGLVEINLALGATYPPDYALYWPVQHTHRPSEDPEYVFTPRLGRFIQQLRDSYEQK